MGCGDAQLKNKILCKEKKGNGGLGLAWFDLWFPPASCLAVAHCNYGQLLRTFNDRSDCRLLYFVITVYILSILWSGETGCSNSVLFTVDFWHQKDARVRRAENRLRSTRM